MAENDNSIKANLEEINTKKDSTSTISFRLPTWLKAKVLEVADSKGQSPSGFSSFVVYKATMEGLVSQEDYDRLKEDLQEANSKVETWEKAYQELEERYNNLEKEKKQSAKASSTANKQLQELKQRPTQNQYDKLQKQLDDRAKELEQVKNQLKEKESARKSEAGKREQLEQRIKEANEWAERTPFIEKRF
jgi:DNA repair exonuclease SbcCD ATPase subunit